MLLDIEEAEELPVASLFERRPDIDAEVQVNDGTQDRGARVENDDRVGKRRGWYGTKTSKERARSRVRERPGRKRLVGNRTEQRDRQQAMSDQQHGHHDGPAPVAIQPPIGIIAPC